MIRYSPITDLNPVMLQDGTTLYGVDNNQTGPQDVTVKLTDGTKVVVKDGFVTTTLPNGITSSIPVNEKGLGDAKTVGNVMQSVGGAVAVIVPIGTIVGGIIAAAGTLISVFANGKAYQKATAEAGQYDQINAELQSQNAQLDTKITDIQNALIKAKKDLGLAGVDGLGYCLINCAKTKAQNKLADAKTLFATLNNAQNDKINALQALTDEAQKIFLKKTKINILYIGAGVLVLGALGYLIVKKSRS